MEIESTKFFSGDKGYGKVNNPTESPEESISHPTDHRRCRRRRIVLAAASFAILLTVVIAIMVIALVHESVTEPPEEDERRVPSPSSPSSLSSNPVEALKLVCSVTEHPDSCISSISSLNTNPTKADPVHFFNLSLSYSLQEVKNLSSVPKELITKANDKGLESALKDCLSLFDNSLSQLNDSVALMKESAAPGDQLLTEMKVSDLQTWISAAMTDEETCLDGLGEMGGGEKSKVVDEVTVKVHKSQEYMSNSLAILKNLQSLLGKFGLGMR